MVSEEELAESVRNFSALYDKTAKEYKDRNIQSLIWGKIAKNLGLETGNAKYLMCHVFLNS